MTDCLSIENPTFSLDLLSSLSTLLASSSLCDVFLVCEDGHVGAHKVMLAATSSFFSSVLQLNNHNNPLIYLRGVQIGQLQSLLEFVYNGVTQVAQNDFDNFMALARDLKIRGLDVKRNECIDRSNKNEELIADSDAIETTVFIKPDPDPLFHENPDPVEETEENNSSENRTEDAVQTLPEESQAQTEIQIESKRGYQSINKPPKRNRKLVSAVHISQKKSVRKNCVVYEANPQKTAKPFTCPGCKVKICSSFLLKHHTEAKLDSQCENCHLYFNSCQSLTEHKNGRCRERKSN